MKPMHAEITSVSRCPCCHSKYSSRGAYKTNVGKSAARNKQKKDLRNEIARMKD
jgi:hypothetical protein